MQVLLFAAGSLALITGIVHSVLGERLILRHLRRSGLVPTLSAPPLRESNIRILWATWHLGSVFGWAFAGILFRLALAQQDPSLTAFVLGTIAFANLGGALLVLIGTKGRHPGWIALSCVAALTWFAVASTAGI